MAAAGLRIVTVAVLLLLLAAAIAALRVRRTSAAPVTQGLWSHVEELRRRVLIVAAVILAGTTLALTVRIETSGAWPYPRPTLYSGLAAQLFHAMAEDLVPSGVALVALGPMDGFLAQFSLALGIGILIALPVALDQGARFLSPALHDNERRALRRAIMPCVILFLLGASFAYVAVLPVTLRALYQFTDALGAQGLMNVRDLGTFALGFMAGFGLAFQTPIIMVALSRAGVVEPATYWRYWRHAIVILLAVAMVVTPDPTIVSQIMLAGPLIVLYLLGAFVASRGARRRVASTAP